MRSLAKFSIKRRVIPHYLFLAGALAGAVYTVALITSFEMRYLSYLLYDRSYLSAVYQLLNESVIRKLIICVLLFFMALPGLFLHYHSCRMTVWLQLAVLCLLTVICCESMFEPDTMFYVGSADVQTWYGINFCGLIAFSSMLFYLAYEPVLQQLFLGLHGAFLLLLLPVCAGLWVLGSRKSQSIPGLFSFLLLTGACILLIQLYLIRRRNWQCLIGGLPAAAGFFALCAFNYRYLCCNTTVAQINSGRQTYSLCLYLLLPLNIYLYALTIRRHNVLSDSRDTNRKIQEIEHAKYLFRTLLSSGIKNHTGTIRSLLDDAQKTHPELIRCIPFEHIRQELLSIHTVFDRIGDYNIFNKNQLELSPTSVNTSILMSYIKEHLTKNRILSSRDRCLIRPGSSCVRVAPERLIQSVCDVIYTMKEQFSGAVLTVESSDRGGFFVLLLSLNLSDGDSACDMHAPLFSPGCFEILDDLISCCRYIVSLSKGTVRLDREENIRVEIRLPLDDAAPPKYRHEPFLPPCQAKGSAADHPAHGFAAGRDIPSRESAVNGDGKTYTHPERLLLLSSDPRQEAELRRLLPSERYAVTFCNNACRFYEKPLELGAYSLILVGNLYHGVYYNEFLTRVRQYFSMTDLPVLLLLPDLLSETEVYIHANINDFLVPPFFKSTMELKIKSLLSLKRTASIAAEARLELLQSQMNPHFIFNSINSIMQFCVESPMTAYRLLEDFSEYLRGHLFTLSLNRVSTIQREIDLIAAYLKIEKARFADHIQYRLNTDCDGDFPILPLLIEPLVENSIRHSPMRERPVTITVDIWQEEDLLHVSVLDTGNGMTKETIDGILSFTSVNRSVGLYNVCNRLRYYYHITPQIESEPGAGTSVSFVLSRGLHIHNLEDTI